jgi:hypothetical protein
MRFRCAGTQFVSLLLAATLWVSSAMAQSNQSSAAAQGQAQASSKVSAEMVKGKLNPATSKPGDQVVVRTKEDLKSNGQVVLKKGTEITGVVKNVKRSDAKAGAKGEAQSMMQVDWLTPAGSGASAQQLNFALQSIAYTNPLHAHQQAEESGAGNAGIVPAPAPARTGGGGGGGALGGVGGVAGGVTGGVVGGASSTVGAAGNVGGAVTSSAGAIGRSSTGVLASPAPVAANSQTAAMLQNNFGVSSNQLFMVGHGSAVSAGGTANSMDIFTHMSNDAVITSPSKDFEVASGAQMDFMVSARGQK